jgi:CubicO group peptidase (beta-lactamase class C family)
MMSAVKGVTALAGHICVDRGLLDLDAPVATYWPEFATAGKERLLVRHVFSHTAGVITVPGYLDFMRPDGTGWDQEDEIVRRIAAATPLWEPGTKATYHAFTFGWMLDELIRRVTGKSVQDVIRDEIATPLGIDIRLGAPAGDRLGARRARVITPPRGTEEQPERLAFERAFTSTDTPLGQSLMATGTSNPIVELDRFMNDGPGITVPLSGTNGIGTARDLARMYQLLARGGELDGVRLLSEAAVAKAATLEFDGTNEFWGMPARWALGFQLSGNLGTRYGMDGSGFGQPGQGGQYAWADPSRGLSFAYVRSYLDLQDDLAPMDALYEAIR